MSQYIFTGRAKLSDIDEMVKLMFTPDKIYNKNLFIEKTTPILKEGLSSIYRIDNELVGFVILTKKDNSNDILIRTVFVAEKYRRQGIATKLL